MIKRDTSLRSLDVFIPYILEARYLLRQRWTSLHNATAGLKDENTQSSAKLKSDHEFYSTSVAESSCTVHSDAPTREAHSASASRTSRVSTALDLVRTSDSPVMSNVADVVQ